MTAVLLLLRAQGPLLVQTAMLAVGAMMLLVPSLMLRASLWYGVAALVAIRIAYDWPLADNHIYLLAYWTLAIALALGASDPGRTLNRTARWLMASAFTCAVIWKAALSPDFADARFFRMTLLVDARFEELVRLACGMSYDEIDAHRAALLPLAPGAEPALDSALVEPAALRHLALTLTWGGLAVETALAVALLWPLSDGRQWIRHLLLLGFCAATYPIAPVAGFGWLLLAMGASHGPPGRHWSAAYVGVWLAVLLGTALPWAGWLADAFGRPR